MVVALVYLIGSMALLGLLWVLVRLVSAKDRYAEMTEEEFEAEAKKSSWIGMGLQDLQRIIEGRKVEYMLQRDKHVEEESADSSDKPTPATDEKSQN